jgi:hypothetical protein
MEPARRGRVGQLHICRGGYSSRNRWEARGGLHGSACPWRGHGARWRPMAQRLAVVEKKEGSALNEEPVRKWLVFFLPPTAWHLCQAKFFFPIRGFFPASRCFLIIHKRFFFGCFALGLCKIAGTWTQLFHIQFLFFYSVVEINNKNIILNCWRISFCQIYLPGVSKHWNLNLI